MRLLQRLTHLSFRAASPSDAVPLFDPSALQEPDAVVILDAETARYDLPPPLLHPHPVLSIYR